MMLIAFKLVLALGDGLLGAWVLRHAAYEKWAEADFLRRVAALQVIPAAVLFVGLYLIGHQEVTSDVPGYYLPAAHAVLAGKLPFRDFMVSYAPLFPYVGAALVWVWDSGKVFALFSILVNAVALLLWHRIGQHIPGSADGAGKARFCLPPADTCCCRPFSARTRCG